MQNEVSPRSGHLHQALHLLVLGTLAIAYPLLNVIQQRPQFLSARGSNPLEIGAMVLVLCAGIPTLLFLLELVIRFMRPNAARVVHALFIGFFCFLILMQFLSRTNMRSVIAMPIAFLSGMYLGYLYHTLGNVRTFVGFLSLALIAVPYNFFSSSMIARAMTTPVSDYPVYAGSAPRHSVFILILDEFPLVTLLNEAKEIDDQRYPEFAAFSRKATWYRNATTVADETLLAVPSILTGCYPDNEKLAELKYYPRNMLAYFSSVFHMNTFESFTFLGSDPLRALRETNARARLAFLLEDLSAVYLHLICPNDLRSRLPPIEQTWGDFWGGYSTPGNTVRVNKPRFNRPTAVEQMIASLKAQPSPSFNYFHLMLPHIPLEHLPSGRMYDGRSFGPNGGDGLLRGDLWQNQRQPVLRAYQRHLLQAMFADKVLGRFLRVLQEEQMYEDAIIVVTSDHGLSFIPGQKRRVADKETVGDIAPVPLFIKYPHQKDSVLEDKNVELVDIAPTIAETVGTPLSWSVDGFPLSNKLVERKGKRVLRHKDGAWLTLDEKDVIEARDLQLRRKVQLFGSGPENSLYTMLDSSKWIHQAVASIPISGNSSYSAQLKYGHTLENVNINKDPLPCLVRGRLLGHKSAVGSLRIAVAVNGAIQAIVRDEQVWNWPQDEMVNIFAAMIPEAALRNGKNNVELFLFSGDDSDPKFQRIPVIP